MDVQLPGKDCKEIVEEIKTIITESSPDNKDTLIRQYWKIGKIISEGFPMSFMPLKQIFNISKELKECFPSRKDLVPTEIFYMFLFGRLYSDFKDATFNSWPEFVQFMKHVRKIIGEFPALGQTGEDRICF